MLRCTADATLATMELAREGNVSMSTQPRPPRARAARAARARIVALVAIAALGVAGAMTARAELRTHSAPTVLAAGTGDIHIGSGG
jgi:anti-sigma factor RsiW